VNEIESGHASVRQPDASNPSAIFQLLRHTSCLLLYYTHYQNLVYTIY